MGRARAKRGWSVSVAYWLIALYVLSLGALGLQAAGALAARGAAAVAIAAAVAEVRSARAGRPIWKTSSARARSV